jgi:hypothetical protein
MCNNVSVDISASFFRLLHHENIYSSYLRPQGRRLSFMTKKIAGSYETLLHIYDTASYARNYNSSGEGMVWPELGSWTDPQIPNCVVHYDDVNNDDVVIRQIGAYILVPVCKQNRNNKPEAKSKLWVCRYTQLMCGPTSIRMSIHHDNMQSVTTGTPQNARTRNHERRLACLVII